MKLKIAYADPPYLGCARRHYRRHHRHAADYDRLDTHAALIRRLVDEFPDGWALSCSSPSLRLLLPLCPPRVRVAAWLKPFCIFRPFVNPAYAWEPVLFMPARRRGRNEATQRDWLICNTTTRRGLAGAKPWEFCFWLFDLLGLQHGDTLVDLFPGTGTVKRAFGFWQKRR